VLPNAPPPGWKEELRTYGTYQGGTIDFLLEGDGVSSFAAEIQGLTSCRARVELRLVPVPGRDVILAETGTGADVDLVEALAAKAALEEATGQALANVLKTGAEEFLGAGQ
jgi:hypothetical protein